jgi:hypothetical protein
MKNFNSLLDFSKHLIKAATVEIIAIEEGLKLASKIIQSDAKKQIGHLQSNIGPFSAWEELADSTKSYKQRLVDNNEIGLTLNSDFNPLMLTGELYRSIEYEVNIAKLEAVIGTKNPIGAFQEFGTSRIPPRPFIGPAAFKQAPSVVKIFGMATMMGIAGGNIIESDIGSRLGYNRDIEL